MTEKFDEKKLLDQLLEDVMASPFGRERMKEARDRYYNVVIYGNSLGPDAMVDLALTRMDRLSIWWQRQRERLGYWIAGHQE